RAHRRPLAPARIETLPSSPLTARRPSRQELELTLRLQPVAIPPGSAGSGAARPSCRSSPPSDQHLVAPPCLRVLVLVGADVALALVVVGSVLAALIYLGTPRSGNPVDRWGVLPEGQGVGGAPIVSQLAQLGIDLLLIGGFGQAAV